MGKLIQFWQKDIINKLIVLVGFVIILTLGTLIYLLATTPRGKTIIASFYPTPTLSVDEIFRIGEQTATAEAEQTSTAMIPTITTMPMTPMAMTPTPSSTPTVTATATATSSEPTAPAAPAATSTPGGASSNSPTGSPVPISGDCPPRMNEQVGKVLEVVDGNTIRVLINDLVYVVRYIGVDLPQDPNFTDLSRYTNGEIVYAKEVKLYAEGADVDENNRLLRYVVVGDSILANQELIRRGLATAAKSSFACAARFLAAEADAKTDRSGIWKVSQP
jgi:endonuclease YncB( thermonuclease family)